MTKDGRDERPPPRAPLFAFGTLMDPDVLALVCDVEPGRFRTEPARAEDSARRWVVDDHYPVRVAAAGESLPGLLVHGLDDESLARIEFFEGEEFVLAPLLVRRASDGAPIEARHFAHTGRKAVAEAPWELADWQASTKADTLPRVRRYMACFGRMSVVEADAHW